MIKEMKFLKELNQRMIKTKQAYTKRYYEDSKEEISEYVERLIKNLPEAIKKYKLTQEKGFLLEPFVKLFQDEDFEGMKTFVFKLPLPLLLPLAGWVADSCPCSFVNTFIAEVFLQKGDFKKAKRLLLDEFCTDVGIQEKMYEVIEKLRKNHDYMDMDS